MRHKRSSQTSNPNKTNKKISKKKGQSKPNTQTRKEDYSNNCSQHDMQIDFICVYQDCHKLLCGRCVLEHAQHIHSIKYIGEIIDDFYENKDSQINKLINQFFSSISDNQSIQNSDQSGSVQYNFLQQIQNTQSTHDVNQKQIKKFNQEAIGEMYKQNEQNNRNLLLQLDNYQNEIVAIIKKNVEKMKVECNEQSELKTKLIDKLRDIDNSEQDIDKLEMAKMLSIFDQLLKKNLKSLKYWIFANDKILKNVVDEVMQQNLRLVLDEFQLESTNPNIPKMIHWFEWGSNKLQLYDLVKNQIKEVKLEENFKVPAFSRSIMLKDGRIYLMGGEHPEYFIRKEIFLYDYKTGEFVRKSNMIQKKYDFSICSIGVHVYVICGKDQQSYTGDTVERYDSDSDTWIQLAKTNFNRYAATAVTVNNSKIFLFGGRGDNNEDMINSIEEYDVLNNIWTIINIKANAELWQSVEVCAGIQISSHQILIFGGSEVQLQETNATMCFDIEEKKFTKKQDLVKPHIFVQQPFLYGKYIYTVGNEYYIKQRNLHKYDIEADQWSIVF